MEEYKQFLESKKIRFEACGFEVDKNSLNSNLFDFQRDIVHWSLKKGKCAIFAGTGLGKTLMELSWANQVHKHTNENVLILAPLAVSEQTVREGEKFGIKVNLCRSQEDVKQGINITNYEMLHKFDTSEFIGVVLDESSILKNFSGKVRTQLIGTFANTKYKLACTATPSPNDVIELTSHAEFLDVISGSEMLSMWFVHDTDGIGKWRLKKHSVGEFWEWVSTWAVMLSNPKDLDYNSSMFDLPELRIHQIVADCSNFAVKEAISLNDRRKARKDTIDLRVNKAAEIANGLNEQCLIWCDLNEESDKLTKSITNAIEVAGRHTNEYKKEKLINFANGNIEKLVSKPSICGFGMNWQSCSKMIFVGLSDSFEQYYQAVRRCWRFGQTKTVDVWIITSEKEGAVVANIKRKELQFDEMLKGMIAATQEFTKDNIKDKNEDYNEIIESSEKWKMYNGDNIEITQNMESESIDYCIFSPPFSSLFTYSNTLRDMGNCNSDEEFNTHFEFLANNLYRIIKSGRLVTIHCMSLPTSLSHDGQIGLKDFRGDLIRIMQNVGFIYHSEVCIYKDPVQEMYRTKSIRLLHKQLKKDSAMSGQGRADYLLNFSKECEDAIPEYLVSFRKRGDNKEPITHTDKDFPVPMWQIYARPVWNDINVTNVLNKACARDNNDEKHICPLQLDAIERCIELWSNPGDKVLDPFAGIGSTPYEAVKMGRHGIGIELKDSYYKQAVENCKVAERTLNAPKQFSLETFGVGNTQSTLF